MTLDQAKRIYEAAAGTDAHYSNAEWRDVHAEVEQIVAAKSDRAAGRVIGWWVCWDRKYTATAFARKVRAEWRALESGGS